MSDGGSLDESDARRPRRPGARGGAARHKRSSTRLAKGAGFASCSSASGSCGTTCGTTRTRCLALGASTPLNRFRCSRGRGTRAASRCMSSIGLNLAGRALAELGPFGWRKRSTGLFASRLSTRCMAPSRHGVLSFNSTCPAALSCTGSPDSAGRVMQRHGCSSRLRSCDSTRTAACRLNPSMAVSKQWLTPSARVRPKRQERPDPTLQERPDPTLQYCYCSPALQPARAAQRG